MHARLRNGAINVLTFDLTGFLGPTQFGVTPVNKPFDSSC